MAPRFMRGDLGAPAFPGAAASDQWGGASLTPSNPGGWATATAVDVATGTFDIEWTNSGLGDGIKELAGISWNLSDLIPGADYGDPGQNFVTRLELIDVTGVDLTSSPQFGFGVMRGVIGSGSESGRIGGIGYVTSTTVAATVRDTTGQSFSGTVATGTYPVDGADVSQFPLREIGTDPLYGTQVVTLWENVSGSANGHKTAGSQYALANSTVSAPAGADKLVLLWGSAGSGLGAASQTARVRVSVRLVDAHKTIT